MMRLTQTALLVSVLVLSGCGFGKQAQIESFVEQEKATLPKTLFNEIRVTDMASAESEIIYYCDASGLDNSAGTNRLKNRFTRQAEKFVRDNRDQLTRIIDNEIKMTFVAKGNDSDELFRFTINPWEIE